MAKGQARVVARRGTAVFLAAAWAAVALANCGGESFGDDDGNQGRGGESGSSAGAGGTSGAPSGGSASNDDDDGGSATTGGSGGAAGTASPAGGMSGGGVPTGGMGGTVAGTGVPGGATGTGGFMGPCHLPADPGSCLAAITRFHFDSRIGVCRPFTYGGCDGNANNFASADDCYGACAGSGALGLDITACESPMDCVLYPANCCHGCGTDELGDVVAVNIIGLSVYPDAMGCALVDCYDCTHNPNPWLAATCQRGRCVAFDARQTELTECTVNEDCRLRAGLACCESCNPPRASFIAVNGNTDVRSWVCAPSAGCAGCVPIVPPNLSSVCSSGRCTVLDAELPQ